MTGQEPFGSFTLPVLAGVMDGLWETILDLSVQLPVDSWALVGGQMVMAHALAAGRAPTRASGDVDILANLLSSATALRATVTAVRNLGFEPLPSMDGQRLHRFVRPGDGQAIDILVPDHSPPRRATLTLLGRQPFRVEGGTQALQRLGVIAVTKGARTGQVPVPTVLGSLILKAAAYQGDSRDRDRHLGDAAFLVSLITDPLETAGALKGSDRKRLNRLDPVLGERSSPVWASLGGYGEDGYAIWQLLTR